MGKVAVLLCEIIATIANRPVIVDPNATCRNVTKMASRAMCSLFLVFFGARWLVFLSPTDLGGVSTISY